MPELQEFSAFFRTEKANVPIPGYLFSMELEQEETRRKVKPKWQIDVCIALPNSRTYSKGETVK